MAVDLVAEESPTRRVLTLAEWRAAGERRAFSYRHVQLLDSDEVAFRAAFAARDSAACRALQERYWRADLADRCVAAARQPSWPPPTVPHRDMSLSLQRDLAARGVQILTLYPAWSDGRSWYDLRLTSVPAPDDCYCFGLVAEQPTSTPQ